LLDIDSIKRFTRGRWDHPKNMFRKDVLARGKLEKLVNQTSFH